MLWFPLSLIGPEASLWSSMNQIDQTTTWLTAPLFIFNRPPQPQNSFLTQMLKTETQPGKRNSERFTVCFTCFHWHNTSLAAAAAVMQLLQFTWEHRKMKKVASINWNEWFVLPPELSCSVTDQPLKVIIHVKSILWESNRRLLWDLASFLLHREQRLVVRLK